MTKQPESPTTGPGQAVDPCADLQRQFVRSIDAAAQAFERLVKLKARYQLENVNLVKKDQGWEVHVRDPIQPRFPQRTHAGETAPRSHITPPTPTGVQEFRAAKKNFDNLCRKLHESVQALKRCRQNNPTPEGPKESPKEQRPTPLPEIDFSGMDREQMKGKVQRLLYFASHRILSGEDPDGRFAQSVMDAMGRASVQRLERWTAQLRIDPSLENAEQVFLDMSLCSLSGADLSEPGATIFARAQEALQFAHERQIRDAITWVRRQPTQEGLEDLGRMLECAVLLGSNPDSPLFREAIQLGQGVAMRFEGQRG